MTPLVTRQTVKKILLKMSGCYMGRFSIVEHIEPDGSDLGTINTWYLLLQDLPDMNVQMAATDLLSQDLEHPWSPGKLRKRAVELSMPHMPSTPALAWIKVMRLVNKTGGVSMSPNEREALDAVGGVDALRRSQKIGVDRAHYMKIYEELCDQDRNEATTIPAVKRMPGATPLPLPEQEPVKKLESVNRTGTPEEVSSLLDGYVFRKDI